MWSSDLHAFKVWNLSFFGESHKTNFICIINSIMCMLKFYFMNIKFQTNTFQTNPLNSSKIIIQYDIYMFPNFSLKCSGQMMILFYTMFSYINSVSVSKEFTLLLRHLASERPKYQWRQYAIIYLGRRGPTVWSFVCSFSKINLNGDASLW